MKPRALFFDLDDTIVSFSTGQERLWSVVLSAHAPALLAEGLGGELRQLVQVLDETVGPAYWADEERAIRGRLELYRARREVFTLALHTLGWSLSPATIQRIADAYTDAKEHAVAPIEDAVDVVRRLRERGYPLALLTNGSSEFQRRKLRRYELEGFFEVILVEGEWGVGKPHPSVFREALDRMAVGAHEVWMIGDNFEADVRGAARVGIAGVWVHHGRTAPPGDVIPLHSVAHIRELLPLLE